MEPLTRLTARLREGQSLDALQAEAAARGLAGTADSVEDKTAFLSALASKGESVVEVTAFARVFRELARDPGLSDYASGAIDIVGTGGDRFGTYNISSTAAIIVAAGGVPVLKHGNRAITSKSGSAEFLAALGIGIEAEPDVLRASVAELNFCFFFAPAFHPAFKEIMPVRQALAKQGVRTIFNILGPLINPARPMRQVLGVFDEAWVAPLAGALDELGLDRGIVVHGRLSEGASGLDELTAAGENVMHGFGSLRGFNKTVAPGMLGLNPCEPEVLKGGTPEQNRSLFEELMDGRAHRGLEDTVCLNAGAGFFAADAVASLEAGCEHARELLRGGAVRDWLARSRAFYERHPAA